MKILITLCVLQTIGIGLLIFLSADRATPITQSQPIQIASNAAQLRDATPGSTTTILDDRAQLMNENRLRQIIREELVAQHATMNGHNDAASSKPENIDPRTAEKLRAQRDLVAQRIESYKGVGAITEPQMDELQNEIAELDEPSRKQMMSLLIRAMNAGTIKGHL